MMFAFLSFKCLTTETSVIDDTKKTVSSGTSLNDPSKYFDVKIYDGTGDGTTNTFKGLHFQPELLWFKRRNSSDISHVLYDAIRGTSNALRSNENAVESAFGDAVVTPTSNGFTITGSNTGGLNNSGDSMVGYFWDAGTAAATASTDGSITPSAQWVNATAGFSISKWTGTGANATIGHGLGAKPTFHIIKRTNSAADWRVYLEELTAEKILILQSSTTVGSSSMYQDTEPTNTVVSLSSDANGNANGDTYVMYCWSEIPGFSKFGSYEASGSSGLFVHLGFRPAFIIIKGADGSSSWNMRDDMRYSLNPNVKHIMANSAVAEADQYGIDFLSNGFTIQTNDGGYNNSNTFTYYAWARNPFKTTRAN